VTTGYENLAPIRYRPIEGWPGKLRTDRERVHSPFSARWERTTALLFHELRQIGAHGIVLQVAIGHGEIRADGIPYARARPDHPGIILSFTHPRVGPLAYPCDRYRDWRDNLRAVALTLEKLRAVDRYGVASLAEQYRGWQALPAPGAPLFPTVDAAAQWLAAAATEAGLPIGPEELLDFGGPWLQDAYRIAAKSRHPDVNGGDRGPWDQLAAAHRMIQQHLQREEATRPSST
jgi:hypothetical protein